MIHLGLISIILGIAIVSIVKLYFYYLGSNFQKIIIKKPFKTNDYIFTGKLYLVFYSFIFAISCPLLLLQVFELEEIVGIIEQKKLVTFARDMNLERKDVIYKLEQKDRDKQI